MYPDSVSGWWLDAQHPPLAGSTDRWRVSHSESPRGPLVWGTTVDSGGGTHEVIHIVPQSRHSLSGQHLARKRLLILLSCRLNSCRNTMPRSKCTRLDPWFYHVLSARTPWSFFLRYYLPHMYSLLYRWGQHYWSAGIAHWIGFELEEFPKGKEREFDKFNFTIVLFMKIEHSLIAE